MDRLPFTVYDFFGYLSAGFILLAAVAGAFVGEAPFDSNPNFVLSILLIVITYGSGQVIANVSGFAIESLLISKAVRRPTPHLFGKHNDGWRKALFPGYCRALPDSAQNRVRTLAASRGVDVNADWALFMHCHAVVKKVPVVQERLDTFLNLYGFCRNCCLALLAGACLLAVGTIQGSAQTGVVPPGWWIVGSLIGATGLFYRYLKFFRQYAVEIFASYPEED